MFCLDFAVSFLLHNAVSKATAKTFPAIDQSHPAYAFGAGALAGTGAAVSLYPFDFVRMATVEKGQSHFAKSTIPFMSVYLGTYFSLKRKYMTEETPFVQRLGLATAATAAATCAELPFDLSKHNMAGGLRMALLTATLRVPLGTLLLIAYDGIKSSDTTLATALSSNNKTNTPSSTSTSVTTTA